MTGSHEEDTASVDTGPSTAATVSDTLEALDPA